MSDIEPLLIKKADFFPVGELTDKHNFKRFYRIENDGSIVERIFLNISDMPLREYIICKHYLRFITRHFLNKDIGVNIISRDSPWDFAINLSNGEKFFIEITSIADNAEHFKINKSEELLEKYAAAKTIPLHKLKKIGKLFNFPEIERALENNCRAGKLPEDLVNNPIYKMKDLPIYLSTMPDTQESLTDKILAAINSKSSKLHQGKGSTRVILDNRTSAFDLKDYINAMESIEEELRQFPFPEIWFYTGYCSDNDGSNAEFSFAPLKITNEQQRALNKLKKNHQVGGTKIHVW